MPFFFLLLSAVILGAAFLTVTVRNLFHAALWLVVTLFGVAVMFALLEANFLAVAQVALYIGAIAILIIFAIMLTRGVMLTELSQTNRQGWLSALAAAAVFLGLGGLFSQVPAFNQVPVAGAVPVDSLAQLGQALVDPAQYALVFEAASVLLVAVLIGAVAVAGDKKK